MTDSNEKPSEARAEARLAKMYPSTAQAKPAATEPSPTILGAPSEAEQIAPERKMFDPVKMTGGDFQNGLNVLADHFGMTPEHVEAARRETAELFADLEVPPAQARTIHSLFVQSMTKPPDDETVAQWTRESRKQLRERYGLEGAAKRVETVQAYINQNPSLQRILAGTGLGSHPRVVAELVEKANLLAAKTKRAR